MLNLKSKIFEASYHGKFSSRGQIQVVPNLPVAKFAISVAPPGSQICNQYLQTMDDALYGGR